MGAEAEGLRRELRLLAAAIADGDDGCDDVETYEKAASAILRLKDLKFGSRNWNGDKERNREKEEGDSVKIPEHFLCPISSEIMRDPVVLASGQTYDRPFIQEWLNSGNRTCPQTQQVLSNTTLIPNHLIRGLISDWCIQNGLHLSSPENQELDQGLVKKTDRSKFSSLLKSISSSNSSIPDKRQAIRDLRLLTKRNRSFRAIIGENPDVISQFLSVLSVPGLRENPQVLEDTVTTILNLSIHDSNKKILGEHSEVIPILILGLKIGNMEARGNSAAALFSLSALDSNKMKIGELGAIKPLIDLLEDGNLPAKKDAGSAIFNLCMVHNNREKAVRDGIVSVVLKSIVERTLVDESLAILALLSGDQETAEEIGGSGGVQCLLRVAKENPCKRNKENAVVVLYSICMCDRRRLREVGEDERENGTMSWIAQNGTSRARRKATGIIERIKRTMHNNTHYSC